jgi:hypothetical protein
LELGLPLWSRRNRGQPRRDGKAGKSAKSQNATKQTPVMIGATPASPLDPIAIGDELAALEREAQFASRSEKIAAILCNVKQYHPEHPDPYASSPRSTAAGEKNCCGSAAVARRSNNPGRRPRRAKQNSRRGKRPHFIQLCRFAITRNGMTVFFIGRMYDFSA